MTHDHTGQSCPKGTWLEENIRVRISAALRDPKHPLSGFQPSQAIIVLKTSDNKHSDTAMEQFLGSQWRRMVLGQEVFPPELTDQTNLQCVITKLAMPSTCEDESGVCRRAQ